MYNQITGLGIIQSRTNGSNKVATKVNACTIKQQNYSNYILIIIIYTL